MGKSGKGKDKKRQDVRKLLNRRLIDTSIDSFQLFHPQSYWLLSVASPQVLKLGGYKRLAHYLASLDSSRSNSDFPFLSVSKPFSVHKSSYPTPQGRVGQGRALTLICSMVLVYSFPKQTPPNSGYYIVSLVRSCRYPQSK